MAPITHHTELLNALIAKYNLKSYLEIGVQNPANNLNKINCDFTWGVDPDVTDKSVSKCTSDDFFKLVGGVYSASLNKTYTTYDLIFIDGFHEKDQVKRDFENSLRCLSDNGFIVIHDVLPENEAGTIVPRETKQWWGSTYQWAMLIGSYKNIRFKTFDIDNGCMVVWKHAGEMNDYGKILSADINWQTYLKIGCILMNVQDEVTV